MKSEAELLEHALNAHGGLERWESVRELTVHHRSGGIAFAGKLRSLTPGQSQAHAGSGAGAQIRAGGQL